MKITKKLLIFLIVPALTLLIIYFVFVFLYYPLIVRWYLDFLVDGKSPEGLNIGTFGDMYGALNTFFSGLAFIGLLVTIGVQIYIHQREIDIEKEKIKIEKIEAENEKNKLSNDKLLFLENLFLLTSTTNSTFIENVNKWISENTDSVKTSFVVVSLGSLNYIVNKLNQEDYFIVYRERVNDEEILEAFSNIEDAFNLRNEIKTKLENHIIDNNRVQRVLGEIDLRVATNINLDGGHVFKFKFKERLEKRDTKNLNSLVEAYRVAQINFATHSQFLQKDEDLVRDINEFIQQYDSAFNRHKDFLIEVKEQLKKLENLQIDFNKKFDSIVIKLNL